ncbi:hypothetical protein [Methylomagnum ishizawai]|uniref:hypothetical protein n=1 Tax=Methylomagnum ishizawai TaxID=1760988 RepID=UPI001C3400B6|nr:hypothetical protein [Methylomagnum ishizawai]BBL72974.1 hypothetical protein MishRS11D_00720 [Methylomagnum ishizawai]
MSSSLSRAALAIAVLAATAGTALARPDEVSEAQVRGCQYLSTVAGSSGYGKHFGWQPIAKADAEKRAGAIGATHIVWSDIRPVGAFNGEARAKAYACR